MQARRAEAYERYGFCITASGQTRNSRARIEKALTTISATSTLRNIVSVSLRKVATPKREKMSVTGKAIAVKIQVMKET